MNKKWLDNYGKAENANESSVSLPEGFEGIGYNTKGRNYSPAWGGQFQSGGSLPGSVGFTYARTAGSAPSEGKYAKKTLPSAQNGIIADKIAGAELRKSKEYQDRKYLESLPQLRQAPSRGEELVRQGLGYADVATDLMQMGNFIPLPQAQFIGKIGNAAGSLVDLTQAGLDFYSGNVGSGSINLASAALPSIIKNPDVLGGYKRSAKYAFGNRSTYLPIDKQYGRMTENQLLGNRALFGALGAETVYDSTDPKFQNGGEMKFYQEGLDWKPKSMQEGGIVEDDMGYWNPDNRGKPVRINSNLITMEGVYEPLLGIDDTGDTKLMLPGENYKFKGEKVTEYPLLQKGGRVGINDLDAQPLKKLNQLTNFTNNPDKNWMNKYQ